MTETELIELIKETRKARKITQKEVADNIGIGQDQYSRYENGKAKMSLETFLKIVQILDLEIFKIANTISEKDFNVIANVISKYISS